MGMYVPPYVKKKGAYGADQTEKVGAFNGKSCTFRSDRTGKNWEKWVHSEKVGAFRANRTEKLGAITADKTQKKGGGLYRGTYPHCFNMGVHPPGA